MFASFHSSGNLDVSNDTLNNKVKDETSSFAHSFNSIGEIPSGTWALLRFDFFETKHFMFRDYYM